jgi:hypothetical protein
MGKLTIRLVWTADADLALDTNHELSRVAWRGIAG